MTEEPKVQEHEECASYDEKKSHELKKKYDIVSVLITKKSGDANKVLVLQNHKNRKWTVVKGNYFNDQPISNFVAKTVSQMSNLHIAVSQLIQFQPYVASEKFNKSRNVHVFEYPVSDSFYRLFEYDQMGFSRCDFINKTDLHSLEYKFSGFDFRTLQMFFYGELKPAEA